jgi:signal transduction histidine kinase
MSHEIRTPLNLTHGFSETMANERHKAETCTHYSGYIHEAATHLLSLVNDVLDLCTAIDAKLHIVKPEARKKGVTLDTDFPSDDLSLLADERALAQIMLNLLADAIEFSPDGGVVRVAARPDGNRTP